MKPNLVFKIVGAGAALLLAGQSNAAGFYLTQFATPLSIGTVGVTNTLNRVGPDSAWAQPAGMVYLEKDLEMATGVSLLVGDVKFDSSVATGGGSDGGNAADPTVVPSHFMVKKLNDTTSVGLAITAPIGGAMDFGDNFVGRYSAQRVSLSGLAISPSIGHKVNDRLAIGGGVSILYTLFEQDVALATGGADGKVKIEDADDWGYQPYVGLTYQFSDRVEFGAVYRAKADVDLSGDVKFRGIPLPERSVKIGWDNPQWLEGAVRIDLDNDYKLAFNLGWQDWSAFSENTINLGGGAVIVDRNFKDTWRTGVALAHYTGDRGWSLGVSYDSSPVDDDDRTIDLPFDEQWQVGAAYFTRGDRFSYGLSASVLYGGDAAVDQTSQGVRFKGDFEDNVIYTLGATMSYTF